MHQPLPRQLIHQHVRVSLFLNLDPDINPSFFLQLLHTHPPLLAIVLHLHRGHLPAPLKTRMGQREATLTNPTHHGSKGDGSFSLSLPCIIIYLFQDFVDYDQLCLASFLHHLQSIFWLYESWFSSEARCWNGASPWTIANNHRFQFLNASVQSPSKHYMLQEHGQEEGAEK
jgi:hypothetical protein